LLIVRRKLSTLLPPRLLSTNLGTMVLGPLLPGLCVALAVLGYGRLAATVVAVVGTSMYFAAHSPRWCRFYLKVERGALSVPV
jgi:hypothetical protein